MTDLNTKILGRVQALLAKAESTEFPEEAEALFAKAQELITRHSIDEVLARTRSSSDKPEMRRLQMEAPYASAKFTLISAVGRANDITVVGDQNYLVTLIGFRTDLDAVEMLFASLVIQATRAMFAACFAGSSTAEYMPPMISEPSPRTAMSLTPWTEPSATPTVLRTPPPISDQVLVAKS